MKNRIKEIRNYLDMNQTDFAKKLLVSRSAICKIESGENSPSEQTINLICREFNVNEKWLKTGQGDMFISLSRNQKITEFTADLIKEPDTFKTRLIEGLAELDEKDWEDIERIVLKLAYKQTNATQKKE